MDWNSSGIENTQQIELLSTTSVAAGTGSAGQVLDVRQWSSYYLTMIATRNGVATNYNPAAIRMVWFDDSAGSQIIYADTYEIFAYRSAAPFATIGGRLMGQDVLHGPFMQIFYNNIGPDAIDMSYRLTGTTRQLPGPYFREMQQDLPPNIYQPDNFIVNPIDGHVVGAAAGSDSNFPGLMRYGRAKWRVSTNQNFGIFFQAGSIVTADVEALGPLAAGIYNGELILPKRSMLVTVHNNAAAPMNIEFNMVSENEKF